MKNYLAMTGFAALLVLSACGATDNENEANSEPTESQEEIVDETQDEQVSENAESQTEDAEEEVATDSNVSPTSDDDAVDSNDTEDIPYSLDELEAVFYVGMDYGTYYEELQKFHFAKTIMNEEEGQFLDLYPAYDGYLGILNSEEEGIINIHRFQSLEEADSFFE